jgi:hypothetical protein
MSKKSIPAYMALAFIVSAVLAPASSAAPVITHPTGTVLATGVNLQATNVGEIKFISPSLTIACTAAKLTGLLKSNSTAGGFTTEITSGTFTGTGTGGDCTSTGSFFTGSVAWTFNTGTNGTPWCIKNTLNDNLEIRGGACSAATRPIRFALDLTGLVTCTYERTTGIAGSFKTHPEDAQWSFTAGQTFSLVSGFGCPSTTELSMSFTQETDTGTAEPFYISS